jgi:hypothetical protein
MKLDINTNAAVKFANTLEKIHKSALPLAVRGTLNKAVFDVKKNTMPAHAKAIFEQRSPNFFKANSRFENATGTNVNQMKATVGFVENNLKGGNNYAVQDLEEQERGGRIGHRSFVPLKRARIGNSKSKNVRANYRLSKIKRIVDARKISGRNKAAKFVHAMAIAGKDGFVLNGNTLFKVNSLKRKGSGFSTTPIYSFKKARKVSVKRTGFMEKSSIESAKKMQYFFADEAKRQISKFK